MSKSAKNFTTREHRTKVIVDTNIWISYLIGFQLGGLTEMLSTGKIELVLSEQLLIELKKVTTRKKLLKYFGEQEVGELFKLMNILGSNYVVAAYPNICRYVKDNFLFVLISASQADILVTGDQYLLVLNPFEGTAIIKVNQYCPKRFILVKNSMAACISAMF